MRFDLRQIGFAYVSKNAGSHEALKGLTLSIQSGECVGILGHEGAGKTTLLQCMAGLLFPDEGSLSIEGVQIVRGRGVAPELRKRMGFAFQFPEQQLFCETVEDELLYSRNNFGDNAGEGYMEPADALNVLGLDANHYLRRSPFSLSMGEARRVALATLLMTKPDALLLDEPTVGLDGAGIDAVLDLLRRMKQEAATVVAISHDVDVLAEVASRIIIMRHGTIVEDAAVEKIFLDDELLSMHGYRVPEVVRIVRECGQKPDAFYRFHEAKAILDIK